MIRLLKHAPLAAVFRRQWRQFGIQFHERRRPKTHAKRPSAIVLVAHDVAGPLLASRNPPELRRNAFGGPRAGTKMRPKTERPPPFSSHNGARSFSAPDSGRGGAAIGAVF